MSIEGTILWIALDMIVFDAVLHPWRLHIYQSFFFINRYSMPFFVHARDEVALSKNYTAKSYLEERLKEIGLK